MRIPKSMHRMLASPFLHHFPHKFNRCFSWKQIPAFHLLNCPCLFIRTKPSRNFAAYANAAISFADNEFPEQENRRNAQAAEVSCQMEVKANYQTYVWLLEGCSNSGSLVDAQQLHGKILKMGFLAERLLGERLVDVYIAFEDLDGALMVFDDLPHRTLSCWNKMMNGFGAKKLTIDVLRLFRQMIVDKVNLDEKTFSVVLRACSNNNLPFYLVELIHARTITCGFETSPLVCNPLIDLYSKNSFVDSAQKVFEGMRMRDSVSWVAMISGLSHNGLEENAICLFYEMHASGIFPTPYIYSSVLSACTKLEFFKLGVQLHGVVFKQGFACETYVCNALVTLYSRSGNLISAEQIFNSMWQRDGVSYNSLISGLAQQGFGDKALKLFKEMHLGCMKPDCVTVASVLSACASLGALVNGKELHSYIIKTGMSSDRILEGALLDLYAKCSDVKTAHDFFLTTETENVVLWNVMLVAYGQLDNISDSFEIFRQMQIEGIMPNQFTYPSILRTCTSTAALDIGEQIHSLVLKTGFQFNLYVCSVLIDMYAKHGKMETALKILRRLPEEDVVSWTAMIAGYVQHNMFVEAIDLFLAMLNQGIQSDNIGFSSAISACAGIQALNQGKQIHAQSYVAGYSDDLSIGNALIGLYARSGKVQEAYIVFEEIFVKDTISWNSLISGFAQGGYPEEALKVFAQMNKTGVEMNAFTFGSAVSAAANVTNGKLGKQMHAVILKTGNDSELEVSNVLISLYSKCGNLDDAKKQFVKMPVKNDISWNAMITCYSQHGYGFEAMSLFEDMKQLGVMPNHVTFVGVLTACSHVGLVNKGMSYFESMTKEHGVVPKPEHYACVVDLLGRAGHLMRAKRFIEEMPIQPDAMTWRTLLSACIIYKNIEVGEFAASHLLEMEAGDSASYVLLSNLYAVTGKWGCRDRARQMMKDKGVRKEPGRSWIEVDCAVHAFFVGDCLHPMADKIHEYLANLNRRAIDIGYLQFRNILLNDSESAQKESTSNVHSEKLAIAFGLLSLSCSMPVHVFKNLRVCEDCHNWIKYVSKIENRAIIVRDSYRFHHFEGGFCSCRDYW